MRIAKSCIFAFNSNIDLVARPKLVEVERFFGRRIDCGGELAVDAQTAGRIASSFRWKEIRMGGQAGNMANAAAALGVRCLCHCYNLGPRQKGLFEKGVEAAGEETGEESRHYVFELRLRGGERDRLIVTHDPANSGLLISPSFAERSVDFIASGCGRAVVAGFHLLRAGNAKQRLADAAKLMLRWRKANPELRIHFEAGDFADKMVIQIAAKAILPLVDSVGMNECELRAFAQHLKSSEVGEVVIHTARYASAISRIRGRDSLAGALRFGHAVAAFKAITGRNGDMREALALLARKPLGAARGENGISVPSFEIRPKFTVGLGDSFATGCFLAE